MAVVQHSKDMDSRERNEHIDAFTANADVRLAKLRKCAKRHLWPYLTCEKRITAVISNRDDQGESVLPNAVGIQPQRGSSIMDSIIATVHSQRMSRFGE